MIGDAIRNIELTRLKMGFNILANGNMILLAGFPISMLASKTIVDNESVHNILLAYL